MEKTTLTMVAAMALSVNLAHASSQPVPIELTEQQKIDLVQDNRLNGLGLGQNNIGTAVDFNTDHITTNRTVNNQQSYKLKQQDKAIANNTAAIQANSDRLDDLESAFAAQAAALALTDDDISIAFGYYEGKTSVAIGAKNILQNGVTVKTYVATDFNTATAGVGIGYNF